MPKFPKDLARVVADSWENIVGGDYTAPELPPLNVLKAILEVSYLASTSPEEGRYPQFNVLVISESKSLDEIRVNPFTFDRERALSVSELRRLAPASDFRKSAVLVKFGDEKSTITGLADLGTSWHRARLGFGYYYQVPHCLIVQVDRPGRLKIFQGQFHVATLSDGEISASRGIDFHLFLHGVSNSGIRSLAKKFTVPKWERPQDFESFWFTAHWNVFAAIANSISLSGHGGMLVIASNVDVATQLLRVKYAGKFESLRSAFIEFINARNLTADLYEKAEQEEEKVSKRIFKAELALTGATERLVEAIRFLSNFASCDGAIVISSDLRPFGFGAEIRAELDANIKVLDVMNEMRREYKACDIEQFGMRHRSAIKLASKNEGTVVLVISQDGPISAVWREGVDVFVKRNVSLTNLNMPWMGG